MGHLGNDRQMWGWEFRLPGQPYPLPPVLAVAATLAPEAQGGQAHPEGPLRYRFLASLAAPLEEAGVQFSGQHPLAFSGLAALGDEAVYGIPSGIGGDWAALDSCESGNDHRGLFGSGSR